jgi:branched-chain amino acid transport system permease protein
MEFINLVLIAPIVDMIEYPYFFFEVFFGGLMTGVMYSLVALGFVLIFKASGVFNFAQGVFALFAALTLVGLMTGTLPFSLDKVLPELPAWLAIIGTFGVMVVLAIGVERIVLRPLVNQDQIIMFMSTIGLAFVLEGLGDTMWGSEVKALDVGIPQGYFTIAGGKIQIQIFDLWASAIAGFLVIVLAVFFQKTRTGRALRAVADDHQAALSVGIPLKNIWIVVWSVAGLVALVAGIMWGSKSGVQFSLSLIALKALPVLILGGFTSVPGAIVGGLIIGVGEKVAEVYWGPLVNGAIENWFAYVVALIFLLFRPQGLFGDKIIERV